MKMKPPTGPKKTNPIKPNFKRGKNLLESTQNPESD
jgi:hypothetical protein